jgi:hypothetical protein
MQMSVRLQVRDVDIATRGNGATCLGAGAESRAAVHFAPSRSAHMEFLELLMEPGAVGSAVGSMVGWTARAARLSPECPQQSQAQPAVPSVNISSRLVARCATL